ncbi:MAG TPA: prepilin-type N-terminal cleavage/methylation domain-containing protein [Solirubrobacteraceae bacterium]
MGTQLRSREHGFTIIEVLIALAVLLVGLVSTLALVNVANGRSTATKGREGATNLAREVAEQVRSLNYSELTSALMQTRLQAKTGLGDVSTAPGWQIQRRGYEYTIATSICAIDDPKDQYGDHSAGGFCPDSSTTGTLDVSPEDLRRIELTTSFADRGRTITTRSTTTINSTSQGSGLPVQALTLYATSPATVIAPSATEPVIGTAVSQLIFRVTVPDKTAAVQWNVEGRRKAPDATKIDATTYQFTWPITGLSDGTYSISAQAVNAKGEVGPAREIPVRLARNTPPPPASLAGGYNTVFDAGVSRNAAEFEWPASPERNIEGYRLYRGDGTLACPADSTIISAATSCVDFAPPADTATAAARTYKVVALYRNASDVLTETAAATKQIDPVSTTTVNPPVTTTTDHLFKLQNSTLNSASPCSGTTPRDMRDAQTGATGTAVGPNTVLTFCSPPFAPAANQTMGLTATAGTVRLQLSQTLNGSFTCGLSAALRRVGSATTALASTSMTFDKNSPANYYTWNFTPPATSLVAGDKLALVLTWTTESWCNKLLLNYGGTSTPGEVNLRSTTTTTGTTTVTTKPNAPTGLIATPQADGTIKLTWNKPAAGPAVDSYRIYRTTKDYTNRLTTASVDATAGATTDSEYVNGGSATYWVTAVAPTLTESSFSNSVTVP